MVQWPYLIRATSAGVPTKAALPPAVIPVQIWGDFYFFLNIENTLFDIFLRSLTVSSRFTKSSFHCEVWRFAISGELLEKPGVDSQSEGCIM